MCENRGYLVFSILDGEVISLLGTATGIPSYFDLVKEEGTLKLPKAFMLGSTFDATFIKTADGVRAVAYIPLGSRPLAL